ncbi:hypothetical protein Droror1_Dr00017601 [Drosera rotundifolia]
MAGTSMNEEMDCGSFFDQIDNFLEFPNDEFENIFIGKGNSCDTFRAPDGVDIWSSDHVSFEDLPAPGSALSTQDSNNMISTQAAVDVAAGLDSELPVLYEDIVQLEWLSTFVEDSFLGGAAIIHGIENSSFIREFSQSQSGHFHSASSPVSVLESSSSCSSGKNVHLSHDKKPRSKRPRPCTFNPRPSMNLMSASSESENLSDSHLLKAAKPIKVVQKKITKPRCLLPFGTQEINPAEAQNVNPPQQVRKCLHCEITKTPQWRAGPLGPKTLCNACGVRYKSGRLFPEYRPAASPTFAPSLHSNSHRKVLEMRNRNMAVKSGAPNPAAPMVTKRKTTVTSMPELISAFI